MLCLVSCWFESTTIEMFGLMNHSIQNEVVHHGLIS
jgi:hypothetical protein